MLSFLRPRAANCHSWKEARMSWSNARNEISVVKVHRSRLNHQEAMQKQKDTTSWSTPLLHPTSPPENGKHGSANWLKVGLKIKKSINFVMYKCIYMTLAQPQAYLAVLFWKQNQQLITSPHSKNHHWLRSDYLCEWRYYIFRLLDACCHELCGVVTRTHWGNTVLKLLSSWPLLL